MERRSIGSLRVSVIGVGCDPFGRDIDADAAADVCRAALDAGINFFDTADVYGQTRSEQYIGRALKGRRDEAVIATKFGQHTADGRGGTSAAYIRCAVEDSLRRLDTDRIDLYQIHHPDPSVPIGETLQALGELVEQGKVLEIGCSNFSIDQLREAAAVGAGKPGFASVQNEYSLLARGAEQKVLPYCVAVGLAFVPYSPLCKGMLTGKYRRDAPPPRGSRLAGWNAEKRSAIFSDRNFDIVDSLARFAAARGHTLLDVAFAWLLAQQGIPTVIAGARSPEQVKLNASTAAWVLGAEEVTAIDRLTSPRR